MIRQPVLIQSQPKPYRYSLILIVTLTLWHLMLAGQVNLSVDEAHYALYGLKLDWSYFDHPPMVGWLNALIVPLSHSDMALRVIPALSFAASNLLLYRIAVRLYPSFHWIGFWTLALINSAFMFQLLSISMLPDTPLIFASLMVFWVLLNLRESPCDSKQAFKNWLWLGFWVGVAGLSKYTAVTLVLSLLIVMIIEKRFYWLKTKGLWLGILIAALMISPVLYWNSTHDWISILYQLKHGTHNELWDWSRVLNTQLAQAGVYSLLLFGLGWWLMLSAWFQKQAAVTRLFAAFTLPIVLLFAMNSGYEMSLPHWTQLAWLLISPAVVYWCWRHWQHKGVRVYVYISSLITLSASLVLNSQLVTPWLPLPDNENIVRDLHGWPEAIQQAKKLQTHYDNAPLFASNWTQASRIGWYAYPQPVYVTDNRFDQFDLWFGNPPTGTNGLMIVPSYEDIPPQTNSSGHFQKCSALKKLPIIKHGVTIVTYHFYFCKNFQAVSYQGWVKDLNITQKMRTQ